MSNYGTQVSQGKVQGKREFGVFAFNENVDGANPHDVWEGGQLTPPVLDLVYLTDAELILFTSTSEDDTFGGAGTQTIRVDAVDENYKRVILDLPLNGSTGTLSSVKLFGINDITCTENFVLGESNKGDIKATSQLSATLQACIITGKGSSHGSHFFVPCEEDAFLHRISFTGEKDDEFRVEFVFTPNVCGGGKPSQIVSIPTIFFETDVNIAFHIPKKLVGGSRIKMIAKASQGNDKGLSGTYDMELVKKDE